MQLFPYLTTQKIICVKISGQAFGNTNQIFNNAFITKLAESFAKLAKNKKTRRIKFVIVVGAGNIWRGKKGLNLMDSVQADYMGMLATNLNAIYLRETLTKVGVKAVVLSSLKIEKVVDKFRIGQAEKILKDHDIIIISSGTGKPGVTTDSAVELYAKKLGIKTVIMGKNNVNSIYNCDPNQNSRAYKIKETTFRQIDKQQLKIIDLKAVKKYINSGVTAVIININNPRNLVKLFIQKTNNYSVITDN